MSLLRAFVAVDISQDVRQAVHRLTAPVRRELGSLVRWVPSENMHLTLKFLGDVSSDQVKQLAQSLAGASKLYTSFEINVAGLNAFPSLKRPRVIVLKVGASVALAALAEMVEALCVRLGHEPESREFHPHLTLGRVRQGLSRTDQDRLRRVLETAAVDSSGTTKVDSVQIYQSSLNSHGALYTKLFSAPLSAATTSRITL